jgi:hypothetical protein
MYMVNTRTDIYYAVNVLSQFMSQPKHTHWIVSKHVLRYLQGKIGYGLRYVANVDLSLEGYADADWAGSAVDRKSTSGCCFTLGSTMVSWCSRKKISLDLSTTKAKYIALSVAVREAVWVCKILIDLFDHELDPTTIHYDNHSCVKISENPMFQEKSKHIEIKYHYIRDMVQINIVHVQYLSTHEQIADIFTKPLAKKIFEYFRERLGLMENASQAEREC